MIWRIKRHTWNNNNKQPIKAVPKFITEATKKPNEPKLRQELEQETGKVLGNQEYHDIITATQNMLTIHGTSLKDIKIQI